MNANEKAWEGSFGDQYHDRSPGDVASNRRFFERAFRRTAWSLESVVELGAGVGNNLRAINMLNPYLRLSAVEINERACAKLMQTPGVINVSKSSILDQSTIRADLSFTKGVLIHIPPDVLHLAYENLWLAGKRWILVAEYYNPTPVEVEYRGLKNMLWKRDFAGEMMRRYGSLKLIDYGFVYHGDEHPQDDLTWFLMEKER